MRGIIVTSSLITASGIAVGWLAGGSGLTVARVSESADYVPSAPTCRRIMAGQPDAVDSIADAQPNPIPSGPIQWNPIVAEAHGSSSLGTQVQRQADAGSPDLEIEHKIGSAIAELNPQPRPRLTHFGWLGNVDGWDLQLEGIKPVGDSWEATFSVRPLVTNRSVTILDRFVEIYNYSDGRLSYVSGHAPQGFSDESMITN